MNMYAGTMIIAAVSALLLTVVPDVPAQAVDESRVRAEQKTAGSDQEIRKAIEQVLRRDPALLSFAIETEVKDGVVTLRGTVDSEEAKRAAAADAMTVPEVKWVNNRIRVKAG